MNKVKEQIKFDFANNCFDVLRLYSAFYVMTLHIFRHIRLQEVSPVFDWWNGVVVLFCISGFLVPASMERSKNTWEFLKKRVLRIIPSLWVCIIVGVIVAAAFCGFVLNKTFVTWFLGQLVFIRDLPQPDFISNFGIGNFQANLWTMIFTVQFYIITAIIYRFLKNRKLWVWIFVMILSMALNLVVPHLQEILPETGRLIISHSCMPYFYMYFAGWFMYRYREKIVPILSKTKILCVILFIARAIYCDRFGVRIGEYMDMIQVLLLCLMTVGFGYSFGKIRFKFDLSYGLYLYHMVVVDIFVQIGLVGNMGYVAAVYVIAVLCALISHYLVDDTVSHIFNKKKSSIDEVKEEVKIEDEVSEEVCEECGRNMVIKYGPHGKFLACPGFPECRNTKPYLEKIGVACPKCGKDIVLRKTKKGRKYYGCENNPECDFMSWQKPSKEKCPKCGGIMVEKGNKLLCINEACGYIENKFQKE